MSSFGGGDERRFQPHQLFLSKRLRPVDIPPRKLLSRRAANLEIPVYPRLDEETPLAKFLPCNNRDEEDEADVYSADQFRMFEFKVRKCTRSRSHDWTDCPFSHPGEKARRRDPRKFNYSGVVCQDFRRGMCPRGDRCEYSHGVFECWLHPARYRTQACKDGRSCTRKICFFAHTSKQLRILPQDSANGHHFCPHSHCSALSPNSTLMRMPDGSPPVSPSLPMGAYRPTRGQMALAELAELKKRHGSGYKKELIKLFQSLNLDEKNSSTGRPKNRLFVDVSKLHDQVPMFFSPSSSESSSSPSDPSSSGSAHFSKNNLDLTEENGTAGAPDLGWVHELCDDWNN
ncbi:hypothetical protein ACET3Z_016511 [Daucus carota]